MEKFQQAPRNTKIIGLGMSLNVLTPKLSEHFLSEVLISEIQHLEKCVISINSNWQKALSYLSKEMDKGLIQDKSFVQSFSVSGIINVINKINYNVLYQNYYTGPVHHPKVSDWLLQSRAKDIIKRPQIFFFFFGLF